MLPLSGMERFFSTPLKVMGRIARSLKRGNDICLAKCTQSCSFSQALGNALRMEFDLCLAKYNEPCSFNEAVGNALNYDIDTTISLKVGRFTSINS